MSFNQLYLILLIIMTYFVLIAHSKYVIRKFTKEKHNDDCTETNV